MHLMLLMIVEKDEDGEQTGVAKLNLSKDQGRAYPTEGMCIALELRPRIR